ncbi:MAG: D-2-hydroxyacid dehydrogenase [Christensenellales bacterium]|jgi:phosphoglycerate dehydrogenase-like enzyme
MRIMIQAQEVGASTEEMLRRARRIAPQAEVLLFEDASDPRLAGADAVFGGVRPHDLPGLARLRWLQLGSAGADGYTDRSLYCRPDAVLTNASGTYGAPIAEHLLAMMLSLLRQLPLLRDRQRAHRWDRQVSMAEFGGKTVGILGLGDIGYETALRAHALGARVIAVKRTAAEPPDCVAALYDFSGVDQVIRESDLVCLCLPHTPATHHILDERRLAMMKPGAMVFNIGRGGLIDQDALIDALRQGRLAGAGLDVTDPEPLPADSPLWEMEQVLITPHVSGVSPANDARKMSIFLDNLARFAASEPLTNQVDFAQGY